MQIPYKDFGEKIKGKEEDFMKQNFLEKVLWNVAKKASESTSTLCFYEPKMPEKLVKQQYKKEK